MFICINTITVNAIPAKGKLKKCSIINHGQKSVLETAFSNNCYINKTMLMHLAQQTGLCEQKILNWFQCKRARVRRESEEETIAIREYIYSYMYMSW